jgi:hypothetical protein
LSSHLAQAWKQGRKPEKYLISPLESVGDFSLKTNEEIGRKKK